jgi:hypothetical protein
MLGQIALAAKEQSQGITHIQTAVAQLDQVSQSNAAISEQSASAAQELVSQAELVKQVSVALTRLVEGDRVVEPAAAPMAVVPGADPIPMPAPVAKRMKPRVVHGPSHGSRRRSTPAVAGVMKGGELPREGDFKDF